MKLKAEKEDGSKLYVHFSGDVYASNIYKDYNSIKELCEDFGVKRNQISFWYSKGI